MQISNAVANVGLYFTYIMLAAFVFVALRGSEKVHLVIIFWVAGLIVLGLFGDLTLKGAKKIASRIRSKNVL